VVSRERPSLCVFNRSGFAGGSNSQIGWSHDKSDDEQRVDWFNHRRLLEPIGNIPPAEAEQRYFAALDQMKMAA